MTFNQKIYDLLPEVSAYSKGTQEQRRVEKGIWFDPTLTIAVVSETALYYLHNLNLWKVLHAQIYSHRNIDSNMQPVVF